MPNFSGQSKLRQESVIPNFLILGHEATLRHRCSDWELVK